MYTPLSIKRSSHYGSNYWEVFSAKMNRTVHLFSDLEYDHWILVESNPDIIHFCEKPKRIQVEWNGQVIHSVFDMWLQKTDGTEMFVEVKYAAELNPNHQHFSPCSLKQTKAQEKWCQENGYLYKVSTDEEVRKNSTYLNNMKIILPYTRHRSQPVEIDQHRVLHIINNGLTTIGNVEQQLWEIGKLRIREAIYWLIYSGRINSNIDQVPLNESTEVWIHAQKKMD